MDFIKKMFASTFFLGFLPGAPATYASFFALIFPFLIKNSYLYILFFIGYLFLSVIIINELEKEWGKDNKKITADEVLGILTTFFFLEINLKILILGFFLFRFYDIFKLPFIRKAEKITGAWGVILDDVLAGVLANISLRIILRLWH
ncbi:MAG: phosphatidylglycerophosphatase A [candidate division WOR-3 bacterium]